MSKPLLKLDELLLDDLMDEEKSDNPSEDTTSSSNSHIAIIGMDGSVGDAENLEEFWQFLVNEREGIRDLPSSRRKDLDNFLKSKGVKLPLADDLYLRSTYMPDIAGFDADFFGISQQEANHMDPNQRMLLETGWKALEDAGYGGENIRGSDTGIFVGYSGDFGLDYRQMVSELYPSAPEISVIGNVKSIIASRLAYDLDLKGPALLVDTACSSGLMAMYLACQAIRNGDCTMAVAAAVKSQVIPVLEDGQIGFGIKDIQDIHSSSGHTKTFDDSSDGTITAEGSFAFVLKSYEEAKRDGDHIHAIIRGGAANQDGASNGITAPNSESQKNLILDALIDAGISAEDISYIEAHGTATKLGDPIEINGIQKAMQEYTDKKQFCAIGSLKSNIGHLDNAAGLGGVAKLVLAMKNRTLPASLNFSIPNKNIPFVESPVYVNDRTVPWENESPDKPLFAGINSFGLSGTNCHLIFQSAPNEQSREDSPGPFLLPLSAKTKKALRLLAAEYYRKLKNPEIKLADTVFTAAHGRMHHSVRLAIPFKTRNQLLYVLGRFIASGDVVEPTIKYGEHRMIESEKKRRHLTDLLIAEQQKLSEEAVELLQTSSDRPSIEILNKCAELYVNGADIPCELVTRGLDARRIPLPTYPFQHKRCWVEWNNKTVTKRKEKNSHPLLATTPIHTYGQTIFRKKFRPDDYWELSEHRVQGVSFLPGTALVEMMLVWAKEVMNNDRIIQLHDIEFLQPFSVPDGSLKELHLIVEDKQDQYRLQFASLSENQEWVLHAKAWCSKDMGHKDKEKQIEVAQLKQQMDTPLHMNLATSMNRGLVVGKRWTGSYIGGWSDIDQKEYLIELSLPSEFRTEGDIYYLHPALMDLCVNSVNHLMDDHTLYLPLSYGELLVYDRMPTKVFANIKQISRDKGKAVHRFHIIVYDTAGNPVVEVRDYLIKSATTILNQNDDQDAYGYEQNFIPYSTPLGTELPSGPVLIVGKSCPTTRQLVHLLREKGKEVIELYDNGESWLNRLKLLEKNDYEFVIFSWRPEHAFEKETFEIDQDDESVIQGLRFLKAWTTLKLKVHVGIRVLTYKGWAVEENDIDLYPHQASLGGFWRIGGLEFEALNIRCIDHDGLTPAEFLLRECITPNRLEFVAYRNGESYQQIVEKSSLPSELNVTSAYDDGVFVVTGGTGDLGKEVAQFLVDNGVRKLVLLGNRPIPPKDLWKQKIEQTTNGEFKDKMQFWLELERTLDVFDIYSLEMSDYEEVDDCLNNIRSSYGRISGVFHLAGRAGDGFIYHKDEKQFRDVYEPKALGALHMHHATLRDEPEIFVMFSSISSIELHPGQADYTSANMFLDTLAKYREQRNLPSYSIQWPAWRETGIAKRMDVVDENKAAMPLDTEDALLLLKRILWGNAPLSAVLMPGKKPIKRNRKEKRILSSEEKYEAILLSGITEPDEYDQKVAELWGKTLMTDELDADDEFETLGGNSLLTSQLYKEYEEEFPGKIDITDLFTHTTIREQASFLKKQMGVYKKESETKEKPNNQHVSETIDDILEQVSKGTLSLEESAKRLSLEGGERK